MPVCETRGIQSLQFAAPQYFVEQHLPPPLPPPSSATPWLQGLDYAEWFEALKHKNQVHVEVY